MGNEKNLIPFKKGDDPRRNLNGRPKKLPDIDSLLIDALGQEQAKDKTKLEAIIGKLTDMALNGDLRAAEMLLERYYGKVKNTVELRKNEPQELIIVRRDGEKYPPVVNSPSRTED